MCKDDIASSQGSEKADQFAGLGDAILRHVALEEVGRQSHQWANQRDFPSFKNTPNITETPTGLSISTINVDYSLPPTQAGVLSDRRQESGTTFLASPSVVR